MKTETFTQQRMSDEDKRTKRPSVPLSPPVLAQVEQARRRRGMTRGAWLREAVEKLLAEEGFEVIDEARRPATRRPNYSERQAAAGKTRAAKETGQ